MVLPAWWIFYLQCQVVTGSFIVTMIFIVFALQTMPGQYHYNPFFSLLTQISISLRYNCEVTSLQQVIYSKPNFAKMCFTRNWRYLIVNFIVILNIILHWRDWCIFLRKHEVIIVNIFRMHTSWQWFMIVHPWAKVLGLFFARVKSSKYFGGIATKIWHFVIWSVLSNLSIFQILVLIRYASVGIKDEPESKNSMFT